MRRLPRRPSGMRALFVVLWALGASQEIEVLGALGEGREQGPAALTVGLAGVPFATAAWQPIRLVGEGIFGRGVVVRRPFGSAVHALLPRTPERPAVLRIVRGSTEVLPRPHVAVAGGEVHYDEGGFSVRFLHHGTIVSGDARCEIVPSALRDGAWEIVESDPIRCVFAYRVGAGAGRDALCLYATILSNVKAIDLTFVVRAASGVAAQGLLVCGNEVPTEDIVTGDGAASLGETSPEDGGEPPAPPPFEVVIAEAAALATDRHGCAGGRVDVEVRRHGPAAPAEIIEHGSGTTTYYAVAPSEAPRSGECRALRLRLAFGAVGSGLLARPLQGSATPPAPGQGSARRLAALRDVVRKLDAGIAAFRSDPRHGLLWRRDGLGDWKMDPFRVGNLEWDTSFGLWSRFCDGGSREDAAFALLGVEHLLVRDRDDASGLFFQHGREHQSGVVEAGHHWADGLAAVASWTDDPWLQDGARSVAADQIAAFRALDLDRALPRSLGWALMALCALDPWASDRKASAAAIERIQRFLLRRQHACGHFLLEESTAGEGAYRVSPFVDGGILVPALERAALITKTPLARDAARRCRHALVRDGAVASPEGIHLVSSILLDGSSGRPFSKAGTAEGEEVLLFLSGVAGTDRAVEGALLWTAERTLTLEARAFLGKPISMLLRALPAYASRVGR